MGTSINTGCSARILSDISSDYVMKNFDSDVYESSVSQTKLGYRLNFGIVLFFSLFFNISLIGATVNIENLLSVITFGFNYPMRGAVTCIL